MSMSNCTGLAQKYSQHWNRKLLSLSGLVPLKVLGMWALVPLELVLGLEVWLALRVLASQLSTSANCSLVLSLWWGFDHERVEDVGLLAVKLVIGLVVEASSQLGSLSAGMILGPGTGENYLARLDCTRRRPQRWMASLVDSFWASWHIWQISQLVAETRDRVEGCSKRWDWSWRITARESYLDFEVRSGLQTELRQRI